MRLDTMWFRAGIPRCEPLPQYSGWTRPGPGLLKRWTRQGIDAAERSLVLDVHGLGHQPQHAFRLHQRMIFLEEQLESRELHRLERDKRLVRILLSHWRPVSVHIHHHLYP